MRRSDPCRRRADPPSVDDEQPGAAGAGRAVWICAVGDLVAAPGGEPVGPAVAELGDELTLEHEQHVAALAPVVGDVAWRVLHHPYAHLAELKRAPPSHTLQAEMLGDRQLIPARQGEREAVE